MATVITKGSSKKEIQKKLNKISKSSSKSDLKKLCGTLRLESDPLKLQKKWRDEWE